LMSASNLVPPFNEETAKLKVQKAEDNWNTKDPQRVILGYTKDCIWRNRDSFFQGRDAIIQFLNEKWKKELDYKLKKELFCFNGNRIAVHFEYEYHNEQGQWFRAYGNEHWEFNEQGIMIRRDMSANDIPIQEKDRKIK